MKYYFISVRTKENGFIMPALTDEEHFKECYNHFKEISEGGFIAVYEPRLDRITHSYVLGKEINPTEILTNFNKV